jgi:hypothetical protein
MSRFTGEGENDWPNQGELWWANTERALKGRRGQRDLRDLETALLELPEKRLIAGSIALNGQVCAVAALAVHRLMQDGTPREQALAEIETPIEWCQCRHREREHGPDGCTRCAEFVVKAKEEGWRWQPTLCSAFDPDPDHDADEGHDTATLGVRVGMTYALAWRIAYLNDESFPDCTPEERYERVLAWVRKRQIPVAA